MSGAMFISRMIDTDYFTEILVFLFYYETARGYDTARVRYDFTNHVIIYNSTLALWSWWSIVCCQSHAFPYHRLAMTSPNPNATTDNFKKIKLGIPIKNDKLVGKVYNNEKVWLWGGQARIYLKFNMIRQAGGKHCACR